MAGPDQCGAEKGRREVVTSPFRQAEITLADDRNKGQSQMQLKIAQRAQDGKKAMADYEAEAAAVRAKTERLKALRLAKEAAEPTATPPRAASVKTKSARKAKGTSASLSQWLQDQQNGGRRT